MYQIGILKMYRDEQFRAYVRVCICVRRCGEVKKKEQEATVFPPFSADSVVGGEKVMATMRRDAENLTQTAVTGPCATLTYICSVHDGRTSPSLTLLPRIANARRH